MENKPYRLRYLPIFEQDLMSTANYIADVLKNEDAASRLVDDVENAILERLHNPIVFEPYRSKKKRVYPYYRIYVRKVVKKHFTLKEFSNKWDQILRPYYER